ncbi:POU domain, class 2, transcription factor 3S-like [Symsagittifera roscoffensis]|uniref:POU domain, class 2, transcription factor 3S-like n=1 Tax=Symsagittifera roscoffensis TaxID=84072 RepID=UPI00307B2AB6
MKTFDLEEEIFKNVDADPKDIVPRLLATIKEKVSSSDEEARNMLIFSQQAVIRSLHGKIGALIELKHEEKEAFIDVDQMQQKIEIPVKSLVELETTLQDVAENTQQPLNVNPIVVLQSGDFDPSMGYPAIEPSTMQQLLILAPTRVTPVCKGPLKLKNPQISVACPVNSDIDTQNPNAETRSAGLNEKDIDMIARKYMIPIPASDESSKLEELESFAKDFRTRRIRLGYTQNDVGLSLGKIYSSDFSQTTVSRFEALNLSFKNMVNLKPFMEKWINDAERHKTLVEQDTDGLSLEDQKTLEIFQSSKDNLGHRRRKRRTCIDVKTKKALEQFYNDKPHPTHEECCAIAEALNQDRNTIRIWFGNRRQRDKRLMQLQNSVFAPRASFASRPSMDVFDNREVVSLDDSMMPTSFDSSELQTMPNFSQSEAPIMPQINNSEVSTVGSHNNVLQPSESSAFSTPQQNNSAFRPVSQSTQN